MQFHNNKKVYLKIATETTFWDRWWRQDVVSCFLQKKKAVNKSSLDMSNEWSNTFASRFSSVRLRILSLHYLDLTSLQIERLKEIWTSKGSCSFITRKRFTWSLPLKPHFDIGGESRMPFRVSCKKTTDLRCNMIGKNKIKVI